MALIGKIARKTLDTLDVYWTLIRIVVPVTIAAELLMRLGVIEAVSPLLAPIMGFYGLPAELGLALLTGMLVGVWGAVPMIFTLAPASSLTVADISVLSALLLFAHGLPIEQKIVQKAGPGFLVTTLIRIAGGMIYAALLHQILAATGWLAQPLDPAWIPMSETTDWMGFLQGLFETAVTMLVILVVLAWGLELLKLSGLLDLLMASLNPLLRLAGIEGDARHLTAIGMFLGISYGGGLLIRESRTGGIAPRQIFLSCVFMGFAHGIIEDTLLVMALGADFTAILVGRMIFAVAATALIARLILRIPDRKFFLWMFGEKSPAGQ
ncbi:hypothetical protein [Inquilinus sp. CAU 1745]|uniref:hypothetical protein n=1 Tax=Inquilinus sp. CAU 1745 TaxID=3140369 RepID=UPI00325B6034